MLRTLLHSSGEHNALAVNRKPSVGELVRVGNKRIKRSRRESFHDTAARILSIEYRNCSSRVSAFGLKRAGAFPSSVSGFGGGDGGEALTSKRRPRPNRIEIDVYAPVFAGFGKSVKFLANEGQIVVSVGIVGIEQHRLA
jgi:hypothetical protein